jgi:hypothetical protein
MKKTPLTTFMKGEEWRLFLSFLFKFRQNSKPLASFSGLFSSEYKRILHLTTMYIYCVYPAMSKKSENLSDLNKKDRNKRHSSPFINVVKGVFFMVRVTLVPVSYLSAPSAVHSYRVPGKFIRRLKLYIKVKVNICLYPAISRFAVQICYTNTFLLYSYYTNKLFSLRINFPGTL